jgi:hypothetical protein
MRPTDDRNHQARSKRVTRWLVSLGALLLACVPAVAFAEEGPRDLSAPADVGTVVLLVLLALLGMALVGGIGYLYRRERGLDWDFQKPDNPDHH